ncbi:MAG: hypothetical protein ACI9R3_001618 [Verrucomicrobiales bacterium]|jgi:hypothetical protein
MSEAADSSGGKFARWLWLVALLLCAAVFAQLYFGLGFTRTIEIDPESMLPEKGHAFKVKLPREHRTYAALHHLRVFEDGKLLGPSERSNNRVRKHGSGRYRLDEKGTLRMSASDATSPVLNGRKYTLEVPARIKPLPIVGSVALLIAATILIWRRGDQPVTWRFSAPAIGGVALALLVVALAVRSWAMGAYAEFSDGGFSINGIPYSDALGWLDQASALFRGAGFHGAYAGQRPFYPVFLASAYHVFGESLQTGHVINLICGSLSGLFLFLLIAHATGKRAIALAAVVVFLFAHQQLTDLQLLITEPMGLTLILAGAYVWWAGLLKVNVWTLFAAGALIGLSNLTRTFTMLGLPLFAFITLGVCLLQRLPLKRTILVCAMFTIGATCVMAPWMIRQKIHYDTFSLSTAGSDLLYSAAADSPGWGAELYDELIAEGVERERLGEAHAFFSKRYAETVKQSPLRYFKRLFGWMLEYLTAHDYSQPLTRLGLLLAGFFAALRGWANGRSIAGCGCFLASAALAPIVGFVSVGLVLTASVAVCLWLGDRMLRLAVVVLLATLFSGAMMSAMIGNFGMNRMTPLTSWVFIAVLFMALEMIVSRLVKERSDDQNDEDKKQLQTARMSAAWSGVGRITAWAMITVSVAAVGVVMATGFSNVGKLQTELALDDDSQAEVRSWIRQQLPGAATAADEIFFVSVVRLDLYRGFIQADEDTSHWARPFLPRNYDRTVAFVRVLPGKMPIGSLMSVQFRCPVDALPQGQVFVLAGVLNHDENAPLGHDKIMIEGLALIPFSGSGSEKTINFQQAQTFPVTPEAGVIMTNGAAVEGGGDPWEE